MQQESSALLIGELRSAHTLFSPSEALKLFSGNKAAWQDPKHILPPAALAIWAQGQLGAQLVTLEKAAVKKVRRILSQGCPSFSWVLLLGCDSHLRHLPGPCCGWAAALPVPGHRSCWDSLLPPSWPSLCPGHSLQPWQTTGALSCLATAGWPPLTEGPGAAQGMGPAATSTRVPWGLLPQQVSLCSCGLLSWATKKM